MAGNLVMSTVLDGDVLSKLGDDDLLVDKRTMVSTAMTSSRVASGTSAVVSIFLLKCFFMGSDIGNESRDEVSNGVLGVSTVEPVLGIYDCMGASVLNGFGGITGFCMTGIGLLGSIGAGWLSSVNGMGYITITV